mmetsp:Transcript_36441/g.104954  ORF Transcript_36441/g.104954 Transcript_36441/m.104954 type:complete len:826 (-) Transcript_36441:427-2904(-)
MKRGISELSKGLARVGFLTFESERDAKLGFTCARNSVEEKWIRQGRLSKVDPFPWLRTAQIHGLEVVIMGYTMDAVRVCNEALHSGFKVVLILLEDQVQDPEVLEWLGAMAVHCWSRYPFRNGPVLISADSSSCMVRLDEAGNATDAYVRTNIGGVLTNSETWQYFKGPVIVVDSLGGGEQPTVEEAETSATSRQSLNMLMEQEDEKRKLRASDELSELEVPLELQCPADGPKERMQIRISECDRKPAGDAEVCAVQTTTPSASSEPKMEEETAEKEDLNQMRKRFLAKFAAERAAIIDPHFWQDRYDPERFGFQMVCYRLIWVHSLLGCAASFSLSIEGTVDGYKLVQVLRICVRLAFMTPAWLATAIFFSSSLGFVARTCPNLLNLKATLVALAVYLLLAHVEVGGHYITQFASFSVTLAVALVSSAVLARCTRGLGVSRFNLCWSVVVFAVIWTSVVLAILLPMLFLRLVRVNGYLGAVYLWPTATLLEHSLCHGLRRAYDRLVWRPRQRGAEVFGDQRGTLSVATMIVLGSMEVGKCTALLAGTIQFNRVGFLASSSAAMAIGLVLNVSIRSGWLYSYPALHLPQCRAWLCPDSLTIFINDCRSFVWWAQPLLFLGVMCGRGWVTTNWSVPTLETQVADVWCWSQMTLLIFGFLFVRNLLEDSLSMNISLKHPAPIWEAFGLLMQQRLDCAQDISDPYHLIHFLSLHQNRVLTKTGQLASESGARSTRTTRQVVYSGSCQNDLAPRILATPLFKHTREAHQYQVFFLVFVQWLLYYIIITLAVGMANFHGKCQPSPIDDAGDILRRLLLIEIVDQCNSGHV